MRRFFILLIATMSTMLVVAIDIPTNLTWDITTQRVSWEADSAATRFMVYFDGVLVGFMQTNPYIDIESSRLSPGTHTCAVSAGNEQMTEWSDYAYLTITIAERPGENTELPEAPDSPENLSWQAEATSVIFSWSPVDNAIGYSVFLDDILMPDSYNQEDTFYVFVELSAGTHKLGVSAQNEDGLVSEQKAIIITFEDGETTSLSVDLAHAHWSFEKGDSLISNGINPANQQDTYIPHNWLSGNVANVSKQYCPYIVQNSTYVDYAYKGQSAMHLEGTTGQTPYLILPEIEDVMDYSQLELVMHVRSGYWNFDAEVWGRINDLHRLQIGATDDVNLTNGFLSSVTCLLDTIMPYATMGHMDDKMADADAFWREIRLPLNNVGRHIVIYAECTINNYICIDEVSIQRKSAIPTDLQKSDIQRPSKIILNGQLYIQQNEHLYTICGSSIR